MKAIWCDEYDFQSDSIYKRPCCPECREPIYKEIDRYLCVSCGEEVEVTDPEMLKWFEDRAEVKYEFQSCPRCIKLTDIKKYTMRVKYVRNNATLEWQPVQGKCSECGMSFIV